MNLQGFSVGSAIALLTAVVGLLVALGAVAPSPVIVGGAIIALAIARLT